MAITVLQPLLFPSYSGKTISIPPDLADRLTAIEHSTTQGLTETRRELRMKYESQRQRQSERTALAECNLCTAACKYAN